ncbi:unnamed protein product, partial [Prorocentrum cordatum]
VDVGTESVPIHISADKNKKMVATEIACKKLQRCLADRGIRTFLDKDNGQLMAKWEPLVRVLPLPASRTPKVEWNLSALADNCLSREEANELVRQDPRVRAKGKSFVAGRVLLVTIHNSVVDFTIYHWNVHNFAIDAAGLKEIQACIKSQLRRVRDEPMKYTVILTGDFNIPAKPIEHHRGEDHDGHLHTTFWAMFSESVLFFSFVSCILPTTCSFLQYRADEGFTGEA